ncbi:GNAT family N-acetyltransferase, partial [Pararhodospirillum oryzae]|uniref:GNAT family N-acetyltransferase n=1 Tax=Pararhodospirillum oryzae TaxID=478448 RepID=UPI0011BFCEFB
MIRPATPGEAFLLPAIERSAGEIFREWPGLEWIADDTVQSEDQHRALMATGVALVADLPDDGVVGFLNGEHRGDALHLWQIAVHRAWQGRGIGRQLIEAAGRVARGQGLQALTLTTFRAVAWNEPLYQRLGFITLDSEEIPPWLTAVLDAEGRAGIPVARRCAMRKSLSYQRSELM